jgi:hypothetical protein
MIAPSIILQASGYQKNRSAILDNVHCCHIDANQATMALFSGLNDAERRSTFEGQEMIDGAIVDTGCQLRSRVGGAMTDQLLSWSVADASNSVPGA